MTDLIDIKNGFTITTKAKVTHNLSHPTDHQLLLLEQKKKGETHR